MGAPLSRAIYVLPLLRKDRHKVKGPEAKVAISHPYKLNYKLYCKLGLHVAGQPSTMKSLPLPRRF